MITTACDGPRGTRRAAQARAHSGSPSASLKCNIALGYIEGMQELGQAYLASPPAQLATVPDVEPALEPDEVAAA